MAEEWDDGTEMPPYVDEGRTFGKGRGYRPITNDRKEIRTVESQRGYYECSNGGRGFVNNNRNDDDYDCGDPSWENGGGGGGGGGDGGWDNNDGGGWGSSNGGGRSNGRDDNGGERRGRSQGEGRGGSRYRNDDDRSNNGHGGRDGGRYNDRNGDNGNNDDNNGYRGGSGGGGRYNGRNGNDDYQSRRGDGGRGGDRRNNRNGDNNDNDDNNGYGGGSGGRYNDRNSDDDYQSRGRDGGRRRGRGGRRGDGDGGRDKSDRDNRENGGNNGWGDGNDGNNGWGHGNDGNNGWGDDNDGNKGRDGRGGGRGGRRGDGGGGRDKSDRENGGNNGWGDGDGGNKSRGGRGGGRGGRRDRSDRDDRENGGNNGWGDGDGGNNGWGDGDGGNNGWGDDNDGNKGRGGRRGDGGGGRDKSNRDDRENGGNNDWGDGDGGNNGWGDGDGGNNGWGDGDGGNKGRGRRGGGNEDEDSPNGDKPPPVTYIPPEISTEDDEIFSGVGVGLNFSKYDDIEVTVSGENAPSSIDDFRAMGLRKLIFENIVKSGYTKPTPVQKYAIPVIMSGRDLMACAPTGSGKTAAFLVPIINTLLERPSELKLIGGGCEPHCVVVSPTRELAEQIWRQALKFSKNSVIKCTAIYGGVSCMHQGKQVANGCHILIATPGRLLDFVERRRVSFASVRYVVLDEADRMLDMGFLESMRNMMDHETMVPKGERQTLMFSATFDEQVQHIARDFLCDYLFLTVGIIGSACADVEQILYEVSKFEKRRKLMDLLQREDVNSLPRTMIFVEMKKTADVIAILLSEKKIPATSIHGDRTQEQREEALRDFRYGRMPILVATSVAARGLDIKDVAHVINYDLPQNVDEYVHRIGRTGRLGNRGRATSLFDPEADRALASGLVRILRQAGQNVPEWLLAATGGQREERSANGRGGDRDIRNFDNHDSYDNPSNYSNASRDQPEEEW